MVEELEGLDEQRELGVALVEEEVDGLAVELEREGLEEGDVVGHDLLVGEVELVQDDVVDVVVGEEEVERGLVADVLEQDVQRLQQLHADVAAVPLLHVVQEERDHLLLQEEAAHKTTAD